MFITKLNLLTVAAGLFAVKNNSIVAVPALLMSTVSLLIIARCLLVVYSRYTNSKVALPGIKIGLLMNKPVFTAIKNCLKRVYLSFRIITCCGTQAAYVPETAVKRNKNTPLKPAKK